MKFNIFELDYSDSHVIVFLIQSRTLKISRVH